MCGAARSRTRIVMLALAAVAPAATGCATTLVLHEERPVNVSAAAPKPKTPHKAVSRVAVKQAEIEVNEKIHFEFDSAEIKPESHDLLDEIAEVINGHDEIRKIEVQGHTDNQGTAKYNEDLSQRRAEAVVDYLVEQGGVEQSRLQARGYGFDKPVASNEDAQGRAKNRRVEFHITERK